MFQSPQPQKLIEHSSNSFSDYELFPDILGMGGFGIIQQAYCKKDKITYAIKTIQKSDRFDDKFFDKLENICNLLMDFNHPNLLKLHQFFVFQDRMVMVMELQRDTSDVDVAEEDPFG